MIVLDSLYSKAKMHSTFQSDNLPESAIHVTKTTLHCQRVFVSLCYEHFFFIF